MKERERAHATKSHVQYRKVGQGQWGGMKARGAQNVAMKEWPQCSGICREVSVDERRETGNAPTHCREASMYSMFYLGVREEEKSFFQGPSNTRVRERGQRKRTVMTPQSANAHILGGLVLIYLGGPAISKNNLQGNKLYSFA